MSEPLMVHIDYGSSTRLKVRTNGDVTPSCTPHPPQLGLQQSAATYSSSSLPRHRALLWAKQSVPVGRTEASLGALITFFATLKKEEEKKTGSRVRGGGCMCCILNMGWSHWRSDGEVAGRTPQRESGGQSDNLSNSYCLSCVFPNNPRGCSSNGRARA